VAQEAQIPEESKELQPGFRRIIPEVIADITRADKRMRKDISFISRIGEKVFIIRNWI
jgi:hypothetical protein